MLHALLESRLASAVSALLPEADTSALLVRPCPDPRFGDYQTNALIAVAKQRKLNPRQFAEQVRERLDAADLCDAVEVAGPGFLNFRLKAEATGRVLSAAFRGEHLCFSPAAHPRTYVVDFSSPNVAKPMHVGHIRSTGIGDSIQRILRLLGHRVITDNHLGDWGTQFGMLLHGWKTVLDREALAADPLGELERIYREISPKCDEDKPEYDAAVADAARAQLVKLQAGDAENLAIWREMIRLSQVQFDTVYGRLGVQFDKTLGESFYNPWLAGIVEDFVARGLARESQGAVAVFSDGTLPPKEDPLLVNRDGEWQPDPALIRKSDGGFNYMTTDLATIQYRIETWAPDEIVYVVDDRQSPHFRKLFHTYGRWKPEMLKRTALRHVGFGKILGSDGRPFKTRSGDTVKLVNLLDEAIERAFGVVSGLRPDLDEASRKEIARVVGLGAVKYQDLLPNRQSDYEFNWDKMLALQGNTAVYIQYQYTRASKVFRDSAATRESLAHAPVVLAAAQEVALARQLMGFGLTLEAVIADYRPNLLCNYLYELAAQYSRFYDNCPVLKAPDAERASRLILCDLTARILQAGLNALGIETIDAM